MVVKAIYHTLDDALAAAGYGVIYAYVSPSAEDGWLATAPLHLDWYEKLVLVDRQESQPFLREVGADDAFALVAVGHGFALFVARTPGELQENMEIVGPWVEMVVAGYVEDGTLDRTTFRFPARPVMRALLATPLALCAVLCVQSFVVPLGYEREEGQESRMHGSCVGFVVICRSVRVDRRARAVPPKAGWRRLSERELFVEHLQLLETQVPRWGTELHEWGWVRYRYTFVIIPYWTVFLACTPPAVPLALWGVRALARRRTHRPAGLCANCGYDLRATPHRCPECGTVPSARRGQESYSARILRPRKRDRAKKARGR